jgi:hypothetical protein
MGNSTSIRRRLVMKGVVRDGKTYTYFGIFPALLRLPLLLTGALPRLDVTRLYCALAATIALCFKLATVVLINDRLPKSRLQAIAFFVLVLSLLVGGAQIQFLKGSIFQETLDWAGVIDAAFVYCAVRGLIASREFSTELIAVMASLAGLALLTRVSTALGLYFATGLLILVLAWPATGPLRDRLPRFVGGLVSTRTAAGLAVLLGFVTLCGIVNYQRWGYMAFRYRMEFYLFLEFTAFLGFYAICVNPGRFSALSRGSLSLILIAGAGFGMRSSSTRYRRSRIGCRRRMDGLISILLS